MIVRLTRIAFGMGWNAVRTVPYFTRNFFTLRRQLRADPDPPFRIGGFFPFLFDRFAESGYLVRHYFQQDLHVAQRIFDHQPERHLDIGSRIDGFVAHVAAFREIEVLDIRPLTRSFPNIRFRQVDLMNMPADLRLSCDSISSLHAIEHFGLGRYGDPVDSNGYLKALDHIHALLKPGGKFYFSVPVGPQQIVYNAHRIFSIDYLVSLLSTRYRIDEFALIDDQENFHRHLDLRSPEVKNNFGCRFGCGIFELTKHHEPARAAL
ncbi:DUF268 domain-containing protein [Larkinella soli]|uniref:DUF268 domain-containing protein n=1 Tax=Larkinella soli TaxID=1770527 RepID=UPI000FFC0976|nr:DUF268 domain-containing protein [Larkinella soli]